MAAMESIDPTRRVSRPPAIRFPPVGGEVRDVVVDDDYCASLPEAVKKIISLRSKRQFEGGYLKE
jgi:hypothetical protein